MKYGIQIKVGDNWIPARPARDPPYLFNDERAADLVARMLYPKQYRQSKETGLASVKVVPVDSVEQ